MIKNLIFDFGKVLVNYDFEAFFMQHVPDPKRCLQLSSILNTAELQRLLDLEEKPFDETLEEIIHRHKEFETEIRTFEYHYPEVVTGEVPGMRELLTRLRQEGFRLYGLTNWCSKVHTTMAQYDIFRLLDGQVISSEEHTIKPDPAIYRILFDRFNLKPEECVFTDDRAENIEGGEALGMPGIVFQDARQYEEELRRLLAEAQNQ